MYFTANSLQHRTVRQHWDHLWAQRNLFNVNHSAMVERMRSHMTPEMLAANAAAGFTRDFWMDIDRSIIASRETVEGMEIVDDLMGIQTTLPIGKTAKLYNLANADIADDVSISIDGQAPYSFDHTEFDSDGDPIPVFTAGFGANWRDVQGFNTVGIDIIADSQNAKMRKFNTRLVDYILNGSDRIQVATFPGQGLKNHRNTVKMDLGAGGANIDLTTASFPELLAFFTTGLFGQTLRANRVTAYDVMWVSHEIAANLAQPYLITLNQGTNAAIGGTVQDALARYLNVKSIRPTYALTGNEFLAYERRRDVLSPLVGMTTGVVPLPRFMPQENYNFQIMAAIGLQVKRNDNGRGGVLYASEITEVDEE